MTKGVQAHGKTWVRGWPHFQRSVWAKKVKCLAWVTQLVSGGAGIWVPDWLFCRAEGFPLKMPRLLPSCLFLSASYSLSSIHFSSVAQSCPTLCNPMNCSMPGLPVHHQLLEFTQTHVHWVSDAIQPSHPLLSPSPPAPNPSQHQGLFQWVNSLH